MRRDNKQVALTTLIDLLVQILFVFTIILVARDVGKEKTGGYDLSKPWQRLVAAIGLSDSKLPPNKVAEEGERIVATLKGRLGLIEGENDKLRQRLKEINDSNLRDGRAPGKPICKSDSGVNLRILSVTLMADGMLTVTPLDNWKSISGKLAIDEGAAFGKEISSEQFSKYFQPVFNYSEKSDCRYVARVRFEPGISGDILDKNQQLVEKLFYPSKSQ